ncbi:MAG: hypothetical protein ABF289_18650, partial [Clostridiales bacterium]
MRKVKYLSTAIVIFTIIIFLGSYYFTYSYDKIYNGVYIGNKHLGGYTIKEAENEIDKYIKNNLLNKSI